MDTLQLCKATSENLPGIAALLLESYDQFRTVLTPDNWARMEGSLNNRDQIAALLLQADAFVAVAGEKTLGVVFLVPSGNPTPIFPADWCYIRMLGVAPSARGMGIGRKLMDRALERARENGEKTVGLHTSIMMPAARHIYEQMGFVVIQELEPLFEQKYWLYRMDL